MAGVARDRRAVSWHPEATNGTVTTVAFGSGVVADRMALFYVASLV